MTLWLLCITKKILAGLYRGESVPLTGTLNKEDLYPNQKNIVGFKVDCRLLVDITNEEHDIIPIEVAKDDEDKKIINDMGKLIREGKDVLDQLHSNISKDRNEVFCFIIQIAGKNIHTCCRFVYLYIKMSVI